MRVGATIETEHMNLLRSMYTTIPVSAKYSLPLFDSNFRGPAKEQFEIALAHYNNTPYNPRAKFSNFAAGARMSVIVARNVKLVIGRSIRRICKTPEKRAEEERARMGGGRGFISLNV
jgi:hypothetical protein